MTVSIVSSLGAWKKRRNATPAPWAMLCGFSAYRVQVLGPFLWWEHFGARAKYLGWKPVISQLSRCETLPRHQASRWCASSTNQLVVGHFPCNSAVKKPSETSNPPPTCARPNGHESRPYSTYSYEVHTNTLS